MRLMELKGEKVWRALSGSPAVAPWVWKPGTHAVAFAVVAAYPASAVAETVEVVFDVPVLAAPAAAAARVAKYLVEGNLNGQIEAEEKE